MREPQHVNDLLTYRLLRLSNTLGLYSSRRYRQQFDLGLPEWRVLSIIALQETTNAGEVSRCLATDKAWVGLTVQKLAKRGLVRCAPDRQDRRRTLVSLTREGEAIHDAILANARRRQKRLLAALGRDADVVIASLDRLQAEAERMLQELDEA